MLEPRTYQQTIFATALQYHTLVVLPTGLGKTLVAKMLAKHRLSSYPKEQVLFLTPTKPLALQHLDSFLDTFKPEELFTATGAVDAEKRHGAYQRSKIIFATPQTIENDIINRRVPLENVSLIIFDEAHRATGDYAYCFIAKEYLKQAAHPKILGLTASPGTDNESIASICGNLFIEKIEVKSKESADVAPYVEETNVTYVSVDLPSSFKHIQDHLKTALARRITEIRQLGYLTKAGTKTIGRKEILAIQSSCIKDINSAQADPTHTYAALSLCAQIIKVQHALELLETQGITAAYAYFEKLWHDLSIRKTRANQSIASDPDMKAAKHLTGRAKEQGVEHPKLETLKELIRQEAKKDPKVRIIIFNQYRDALNRLVEELRDLPSVDARAFIGQAKKKGQAMTQKQQKETIEAFSSGSFNVLVMTSVGEEGLDIPSVDLVVFYEPIPSAIRTIQRRGRTGRHRVGRIITLVAKGTIDVAYRFSAQHKEKNMYQALQRLAGTGGRPSDLAAPAADETSSQHATLASFDRFAVTSSTQSKSDAPITIVCDARENGLLIKKLHALGITCEVKNIGCDFYLSRRCGVERKKIKDFVDSIIDGRLLLQLRDLKSNFERPLLLLEGEEDLYALRAVHPQAIHAMFATIAVSYGIPVLWSKTETESAQLLLSIAKREQEEGQQKDFNFHFEKKQFSLDDELLYIVSAIPQIGPITARTLLSEFGSLKGIFGATINQLRSTKGITEKTARHIKEIFCRPYRKK